MGARTGVGHAMEIKEDDPSRLECVFSLEGLDGCVSFSTYKKIITRFLVSV